MLHVNISKICSMLKSCRMYTDSEEIPRQVYLAYCFPQCNVLQYHNQNSPGEFKEQNKENLTIYTCSVNRWHTAVCAVHSTYSMQ